MWPYFSHAESVTVANCYHVFIKLFLDFIEIQKELYETVNFRHCFLLVYKYITK